MSDRIDFAIVQEIERTEMWASLARLTGHDVGSVVRAGRLMAEALLVPVCGSAYQRPGTRGFEPDGAMMRVGSFRFQTIRPVSRILFAGWMPTQHAAAVAVTARCGTAEFTLEIEPGQSFDLVLEVALEAGVEDELTVGLSSSFQPAALGLGGDTRHIGCIIRFVEFS